MGNESKCDRGGAVNSSAGEAAPRHLLLTVVLSLGLVCAVAVSIFFGCGSRPSSDGEPDFSSLNGIWVRTDGGYVLQIAGVNPGGELMAGYYNPRPINVGRAEAHESGGRIWIVVELQDVGYPGSTYNLTYNPEMDQLIGTYFQAVQQATYDIAFIRQELPQK